PADDVAEASVVLADGSRVRALALRLVGRDGRWLLDAFQIGRGSRPVASGPLLGFLPLLLGRGAALRTGRAGRGGHAFLALLDPAVLGGRRVVQPPLRGAVLEP